MSFDFKCDLCKKEVKHGRKFSVDSTEWETEHSGGYGGIDEEYVCVDCRNEVQAKVESMRK
jgi:hypothetical protein